MRFIGLILILMIVSGCDKYDDEIISAHDNGTGKGIKLYVKQDASDRSLLQDEDNGTLKWTDTGLIVSSFLTNTATPTISLSIRGRWYPFGSIKNNSSPKECITRSCNETDDMRCTNLPPNIQIVTTEDNEGCALSKAKGVYMLIAKNINGITSDPNINAMVANSPSSADGFYTAHLGDYTQDKNGLMIIDKMWECANSDSSSNSIISCNPVPISKLIGGKIYLKIYDSYYNDNSADYSDNGRSYIFINIERGVIYSNVISQIIRLLVNTIDNTANALSHSLVQSLKNVILSIIILYIAFTGFMFMTGLSKITQKEAFVKLIKLSIVMMFFNPDNMFAQNFPKIYQGLANISSNIIMNNINRTVPMTVQDENVGGFEESLSYLMFFDGIVNQMFSRQVHLKLIALLFSIFYWILPFMVIFILMILYTVLQSMLLYTVAYTQIGVLIVILPILVPALLFQTTAELFQSWLKYMANSAILIVVATMGLGLILKIMTDDFTGLISYAVTVKSFCVYPVSYSEVISVLNFKTYMSALIRAFICYSFVNMAPQLANALSDANLSPSADAFRNLSNGLNNMGSSIVGELKMMNNKYLIGRLMDQAYKTNGKYDKDKEGKGVLNKWRQTRQKIEHLYKQNAISKLIRPLYIDERTLKSEKESYENYQDNLSTKRYNDYEEKLKQKEAANKSAIEANLNTIQNVDIGGRPLNLSNPGDTIDYNNQTISKQDIRQAIAENKQLTLPDGTNVALNNPQIANNVAYNMEPLQQLQETQNKLSGIKEQLQKIRRN